MSILTDAGPMGPPQFFIWPVDFLILIFEVCDQTRSRNINPLADSAFAILSPYIMVLDLHLVIPLNLQFGTERI